MSSDERTWCTSSLHLKGVGDLSPVKQVGSGLRILAGEWAPVLRDPLNRGGTIGGTHEETLIERWALRLQSSVAVNNKNICCGVCLDAAVS